MTDQEPLSMSERRMELMQSMETIPTQVYWAIAMGAVVFSAVLYLLGRRSSALFVGQWPPTLLSLALLYKLLRPSQEQSNQPATAGRSSG